MPSAAAPTSMRTAARRRPREQHRSRAARTPRQACLPKALARPHHLPGGGRRSVHHLALLLIALTGFGLGVSAAVLAEIAPVLLLAPAASSIRCRA
jgi:hypothetical protein